jgi:5-methylcytosine-specific restriction endonuclease McrA
MIDGTQIAILQQGKSMLQSIQPRRKVRQSIRRRLKGFYNSWRWRKLRYEVLKEYGATCQCCGVSAADGVPICVDHIRPLRKYWDLRLERSNLQILCGPCNMGKASRDETDFRRDRHAG